ncbi:MAG: TIGR03905 family TSCPD domain-containing protein [Lachnospiraceae bacterium]|jgi:uncharacterized protein (TIGR03905 family)
MKTTFYPTGVCSRRFDIEIENGIIKDIAIKGGCSGNLKGIAALIKNKPVQEIIPLLRGIKCGYKNTSCPDQISLALEEALNNSLREDADRDFSTGL